MAGLSDHTAAGQALGYFFQLDRAMAQIAIAKSGTVIGLETEDDIVVKLNTGEKIHEQDKSSTTSFPFMPSKPDLWKSLCIWAEAIKNEEINPDITSFLLVTNKTSSDCLAMRISKALDNKEINVCLKEILEAKKTSNNQTKKFIDELCLYDKKILKIIISKTTLISGESITGESLKRQLLSDLQIVEDDKEIETAILNEVYGWLFNQVRSNWQQRKPAWIERDSLMRVKNKAISRHLESFLNERILETRDLDLIEKEVHVLRTYVGQLKLIRATDQEILDAISDFLNSAEKRTQLAKKAYFTEKDINEMIKNLKIRWNTIFKRNQIQFSDKSKEDQGKLICLDTLDHNVEIANVKTSSYFLTRGTYHHLADTLDIGWHPEFIKLLPK